MPSRIYSISVLNAEGFRSRNISLSPDSLQLPDKSDAKYSELDVSVDFAVVNLVPPTFIVMGPDDASDERFCILAGGSPLLVEDMITRDDESV